MTAVAIIGGVSDASEFSQALIISLIQKGFYVVCIARKIDNKPQLLASFYQHNQVELIAGDLNDNGFLTDLVQHLEQDVGPITVYIHNAAQLTLKPFLDTNVNDFENSWDIIVKTAVNASHNLLPRMLARSAGTILFTGATASIKGNAGSSPFAVAKFGLRALAQSLAREFSPQGIHVCHVITDGIIVGNRAQQTFKVDQQKCIQAMPLAKLYLNLIEQDPSCWTHEIDLRPATETF